MHEPGVYESSLRNDFVIAQADKRAAYDERLRDHVDARESFRALAVYILVNAALPMSLCRLILAAPDEPSSIKATLLLSDLLGEAATVLPSEWRLSVLSLPSLIHSACESVVLSLATAATKGYPLPDEGKDRYTFQNSDNAAVLLLRLDRLQSAWHRSEEAGRSQPAPTSLLALFVPRPRMRGHAIEIESIPSTPRHKHSMDPAFVTASSLVAATLSIEDDEDKMVRQEVSSTVTSGPISDNLLSELLSSVDEIIEGTFINWRAADVLMERITRDQKMMDKLRSNDRMHAFLEHILAWMRPSSRNLCATHAGGSHALAASVGKSAIEIVMRFAPEEISYNDMLQNYVDDLRDNLVPTRLKTGAFALKYINYHGAMYYFSLLGALSGQHLGVRLMEKTGIFQIFFDLMNEQTVPEHVKLVVCSLDFSSIGLPRAILQKALTATVLPARVWCTRFLGVLASLDLPEFGDWGIRLMVGQVGDESLKVVRHAVRLLHTWLPLHPSSLSMLRTVPFDSLGDAGALLRVHLFADPQETSSHMDEARDAIGYWMRTFNARYAAAVEEEMRIVMLGVSRSMDGRFARASHDKGPKHGVRLPVHLFAALASHSVGRKLLEEEGVVKRLMRQIEMTSSTDYSTSLFLKAALYALAHIGSAGMSLLPMDVVATLIWHAEEADILSVRGAAFSALNVLGSGEEGARALARFGWESNRYQRTVEKVRKEMEVPQGTRGSQSSGTVGELEVRGGGSQGASRRATRARTFVSESAAAPDEEADDDADRRRASGSRSSSAPGRTTRKAKRRIRQKRSSSSAPRLDCDAFLGGVRGVADGADAVGGGLPEEEEEVPLGMDEEDDLRRSREASIRQQRSRRQTVASSGPLSPLPRPSSTLPSAIEDRTHSDSISILQAIEYGLSATREQLHDENGRLFAGEWTRRPHFSSNLRTYWKLSPIMSRRSVEANRNYGAPITYFFLPQNELESLATYRELMEHDTTLRQLLDRSLEDTADSEDRTAFDPTDPSSPISPYSLPSPSSPSSANERRERRRRGRSRSRKPLMDDHTTWTDVVLPAELEIACRGIFEDVDAEPATKPRASSQSYAFHEREGSRSDEIRGQKGGYGRIRLEGQVRHHNYTVCFYCVDVNKNTGRYKPFVVPNEREWAQLRAEVISHVDELEIKRVKPEKQLLTLRKQHPRLFDWPCLYADVLELLDEYRFTAQSRTFLQELFYNALQLAVPEPEEQKPEDGGMFY